MLEVTLALSKLLNACVVILRLTVTDRQAGR